MSFTESQQQAISADGNVLVLAGAGTGKTRTMVARCLDRVFHEDAPVDLDRILMVTFTEAAAAEMKQRIGAALRERLGQTTDSIRVDEQIALLDTAKIGTLHSFALEIIREFSHKLDLSTGLRVLSSEESYRLAESALAEVFEQHYENRHSSSQELCAEIRQATQGNDRPLRALVFRVYQYIQSLPNPQTWIETQATRNQGDEPTLWRAWLLKALPDWIDEWQALILESKADCANLQICFEALEDLRSCLDRAESNESENELRASPALLNAIAVALHRAAAADLEWPRGTKTRYRKPLEGFFDDLQFLTSLIVPEPSDHTDPIQEDWNRSRSWNRHLLQLTQEFSHRYSAQKALLEGLDFQDLEQRFLDLLYNPDRTETSPLAQEIQKRFDYVFVDEYQDINGAQDAIVAAVSRTGEDSNLFVVGDIKQSIYRFRRANPEILKRHETIWQDGPHPGTKVFLQANFRSDPLLLNFVNEFCSNLSANVPGFDYDENARLQAGRTNPESSDPSTKPAFRVAAEMHVLLKEGLKDTPLSPLEAEAHIIAQRIRTFIDSETSILDSNSNETRALEWSDFAILLRSVSDRPRTFARIFSSYGIPIQASPGSFFEFPEIADLIALLKVIDNPLQDIPLLALLRSPFFGFSPNELALVRLAKARGHFWQALNQFIESPQSILETLITTTPLESEEANRMIASAVEKTHRMLANYQQWMHARRTDSIAAQIEEVLATGFYVEYIASLSPNRNPRTQIRQLLQLTREFEQQADASLTHFLRWIDALIESDHEIEPLPEDASNAVQLMSIHKSKGLEFPIVIMADLAKRFNFTDLSQQLIIDESYGLCPILHLPNTAETYPSLPHWLSQREHRKQLIDEEARLLYVGLTRAKEHLILVGEASEKQLDETWPSMDQTALSNTSPGRSRSFLDWLGPWTVNQDLKRNEAESPSENQLESAVILYHEPPTQAEGSNNSQIDSQAQSQLSESEANLLNTRFASEYRYQGATTQRAKGSISALERLSSIEPPSAAFHPTGNASKDTPNKTSDVSRGHGKSAGLAYHRVFQFLPPALGAKIGTVIQEFNRLEEQGILSADERAQINPGPIVEFWTSEIGERIRGQADRMHRELPFTARFSVTELLHLGFAVTEDPNSADEPVILQGVVDLAVIIEAEIWVLDFKSEQMNIEDVDERTQHHAEQLAVYNLALEKIYRRPVTHSWIHFLHPGVTVDLKTDKK